jgi:hypothetical protein
LLTKTEVCATTKPEMEPQRQRQGATTVVQINTIILAWKGEVSLRESFEVENGGKVVGEGDGAWKMLRADYWDSLKI